MWSDKESKIDFLNFNEIAESIKDLITEKQLMPISIGVFGDWGAGKSTIMKNIMYFLDPSIKNEQEKRISTDTVSFLRCINKFV
jgi:ABC-type Mn2+/Zn2+ transport system ATPase subunit